ncbi:MAG: hypothetical protein Q7T33_09405 [Dehalococcoidia bacterium]|nr:hypothetical protein [Dehalococcoidia bacterium]
MDNAIGTNRRSGRWLFSFICLGAIAAVALGALAAWQADVQRSRADEMESHAASAALLQGAGVEARASAELLRTYVETGDEALLPQFQSHATVALEGVTGAAAQGAESARVIAGQGSGLIESAGQVIALRKVGDVQGAAAAMEQMSLAFEGLSVELENAIVAEQGKAATLEDSAASADALSSRLLLAGLIAGGLVAIGAVAFATGAIFGRRTPKTASPI